MKNIFISFCLINFFAFSNAAEHASADRYNIYDTVTLPTCIQKLNKPGSKGIRSYNGARKFTHIHTLENGKLLYAFQNEASIGCNANEPAGTKYYDDSCKIVARFPANFSIKQGFKPFVAAGYKATDFPESLQGDYPLYFNQSATAQKEEKITDAFAREKWFVLGNAITPLLDFKKGDVIKVHTQTGLWHYRNKKLLNQYKIVPQLATITQHIVCARAPCPPVVTKKLVYFLGAAERFIDIRFNGLMISETQQKDANSPNKALETKWIKAYDIKPQANK